MIDNLILLIIISIGIVNIIQNEIIFSKIRRFISCMLPKFYLFMMCPVCLGFWIALLVGIFIPIHSILIINLLFSGVIGSISNKIFALLLPERFNLE